MHIFSQILVRPVPDLGNFNRFFKPYKVRPWRTCLAGRRAPRSDLSIRYNQDVIFKFCPVCGAGMEPFTEDGFPREKCSRCGWIHYHNPRPTVSAIIARDGKVLLCQRAAGPFAEKWDLPGGFLEEGESAEEGLRREMKEELGIGLTSVSLLGVEGPAYYPFGGQDNYNIDIYYVVEPIGEPEPVEKSDVAGIDWFDPDKLPEMAFETNVKAIEVWKKLLKSSPDRQQS